MSGRSSVSSSSSTSMVDVFAALQRRIVRGERRAWVRRACSAGAGRVRVSTAGAAAGASGYAASTSANAARRGAASGLTRPVNRSASTHCLKLDLRDVDQLEHRRRDRPVLLEDAVVRLLDFECEVAELGQADHASAAFERVKAASHRGQRVAVVQASPELAPRSRRPCRELRRLPSGRYREAPRRTARHRSRAGGSFPRTAPVRAPRTASPRSPRRLPAAPRCRPRAHERVVRAPRSRPAPAARRQGAWRLP